MTKFDDFKAKTMKKLADARKQKLLDKPAIKLLDEINAKKDFFTSSSCYGRIMLIRFLGDKKEKNFVKKWHRKVKLDELMKALENENSLVWLRMEPLILHISCRNVDSANKLLKAKETAGIKRGGIFNIQSDRVQMEIIGTQRVEALLKKGKTLLVSKDYINTILDIANERFDKNKLDWEKLRKEIKKIN